MAISGIWKLPKKHKAFDTRHQKNDCESLLQSDGLNILPSLYIIIRDHRAVTTYPVQKHLIKDTQSKNI